MYLCHCILMPAKTCCCIINHIEQQRPDYGLVQIVMLDVWWAYMLFQVKYLIAIKLIVQHYTYEIFQKQSKCVFTAISSS